MMLKADPIKLFTVAVEIFYQVNYSRVWVGQILEFVELILFLKTYLGGGLAPYSQTVGSLVIPPGQPKPYGKCLC
jgi:hypothetical protein